MVDLFSFGDEKLDLSTRQQIDEVCIAFEDAWKSEERPSVEEFITRLPETARRSLFRELLLVELDYRRRLGEEPRSEEYQSRFPGFEKVVASVFDKPPLSRTSRATPVHASQQDTLTITTSSKSAESSSDAGQNLGRFELRGRLGAGGFGTVYRAYDTMLHREVALKLPHPGRFETEESRIRVLREARAAAKLYHPHIVPVHDAGVERDVFYIASAFVEGESLAQTLARREPDFDEAATIVLKLATALQYAHDQGIIHRDVKPGNVMMDADGDPRLMDFGLARFLESEDRLTHDGTILGTPAYMSPEQARGAHDRVGPASDQYSLGVVLYQSLCGDVPFAGTPATVVSDVVEKEPLAPRTVRRQIPRDLETICLKSLAKVPEERYPSCQHLADDLERWLRNEPIAARPVGFAGRAWRWCKRKPVVAGLSAALVAALLVGSVVSLAFGIKATHNARALTVTLGDLGRKKAEAVAQRDRADDERRKAENARNLAGKERDRAEKERDRAEANFYINQIALARHQADQGNMAFTERLLDACPPSLRHFEWGYLKRLCHLELMTMPGRGDRYGHVAVSPDGQRIASGATREDGFMGVVVWEAQTGKQLLEIALESERLYDLAFGPDGRHLGAVLRWDESARVWDTTNGEEWLLIAKSGKEGMTSLAFAPDDQRLAVGGKAGTISIYDLTAKKQQLAIATGNGEVQALHFSPDGKQIASEGQWVFQLWDAMSGQAIRTITQDPQRYGGKLGVDGTSALAFSPSGRRIATAAPKVAVWDTDTGEQLLKIDANALDLAFSPDGRQLAGELGGKIKFWDSLTGEEVHRIFGRYASGKLSFTPDGKRIVTGGAKVCVWDLEQSQKDFDLGLRSLGGVGGGSWTLAFHPEKQVFVAVGTGTEAAVYNTANTKKVAALGRRWDSTQIAKVPRQELMRWGATFQSVALSLRPDAMRLAEICFDNQLRIWEVDGQSPVATLQPDKHLQAVAFSPDGQHVALVMEEEVKDIVAELWDVNLGKRLQRLEAQDFWGPGMNPAFLSPGSAKPFLPITGAAFRPDGRHVAVAVCTGGLKVWDVATGNEVYTLQTHPALKQIHSAGQRRRFFLPNELMRLAYSCDSRHLATCSDSVNAVIKLWDADNGEPLGVLEGHTGRVNALAFSSDGRRLISGSKDNTVRIWDVPTVSELIRFETPGEVWAVAISPDNQQIACWFSSSGAPMVRIWDAVKGDDLSFPRRARSSGSDAVTPSGTTHLRKIPTRSGKYAWTTRSAYPIREAVKEAEQAPQPVSYEQLNQSGTNQLNLRLSVRQQPYPEANLPRVSSLIRLEAQSEEPLRGEPEYASRRVQYGKLKVGDGPDPDFSLAIVRAPGEPPLIYLDRNNDEDLSNDGPGCWPDQVLGATTGNQYAWNLQIDVPYATGSISQYFLVHCPMDDGVTNRLTWFLNACRECTVESKGVEYRMILVDSSTDACFDDMKAHLAIRSTDGSVPAADKTKQRVNTPFALRDEKWKVVRLSADGTEMTLEPYRESAKQQSVEPKGDLSNPHAAAESRIAAVLRQSTKEVFDGVPLVDVQKALIRKHKITIALDFDALAAAKIPRDVPVTCDLTDVSLQDALKLMLHPLDLTFLVWKGCVLITTPQAEQRIMITKTYVVADLLAQAQESTLDQLDFDSLIKQLLDHVSPSSWENVGGPGLIQRSQLDGLPALTVKTSYYVHEGVANYLKRLQHAIAPLQERRSEAESLPVSTDHKPSSDNTAPEDSENALE